MVFKRKEPEKIHQVVTYFDAEEMERLENFCKSHRLPKAKAMRILFMYACIYLKEKDKKQSKEQ